MPRGIPKSGVRKKVTGRPKKYSGELVQKWLPKVVAHNIDNIYELLVTLEDSLYHWELLCEQKKTSPRYEQARKLTAQLRVLLGNLGFKPSDIYASSQQSEVPEDDTQQQE